MPPQVVAFTTDKRFVRRARELKTIEAMVRLYCRGHGHPGRAPLCADCAELLEYATRRLERCVFGDAKPTCANCTVHCYSAEKREQIRVVMQWAGPRMALRHPDPQRLPPALRAPAGAHAAGQAGEPRRVIVRALSRLSGESADTAWRPLPRP